MKPSDIHERHIYCNRGQGTVLRFVMALGDEYRPWSWHSSTTPPNEPGVLYRDSKGRSDRLYLSSFAKWCGQCVAIAHSESFELIGTHPIDLEDLATFRSL